MEIVYPVHLNPNVQEPVNRILKNIEHITLLPPLDYLPLVHLMKHAKLILTDSGRIQEEAPTFGIPVLVLREVTERPEGVAARTLKLAERNPLTLSVKRSGCWMIRLHTQKWLRQRIRLETVTRQNVSLKRCLRVNRNSKQKHKPILQSQFFRNWKV